MLSFDGIDRSAEAIVIVLSTMIAMAMGHGVELNEIEC